MFPSWEVTGACQTELKRVVPWTYRAIRSTPTLPHSCSLLVQCGICWWKEGDNWWKKAVLTFLRKWCFSYPWYLKKIVWINSCGSHSFNDQTLSKQVTGHLDQRGRSRSPAESAPRIFEASATPQMQKQTPEMPRRTCWKSFMSPKPHANESPSPHITCYNYMI